MSGRIDELSLADALRAFGRADALAIEAAARTDAALLTLVPRVARAWRLGHRLLLFGAGTSGRLAFQQAAECLPTFGLGSEAIAARIAGGEGALVAAREGAEDQVAAGADALEQLGAGSEDIVLGVTASGSTPFVRGCLDAAAARGALRVLLSASPAPRIETDILLCTPTGPELLAGSTRLKAATAAKCVLDRLTTLAACQLGRVRAGLMLAMRPSNAKLRERAVGIVASLKPCSEQAARAALEDVDWDIRAALEA